MPPRLSVQRGFTLLELMIVVTIVGILATLAEPAFQRTVVKAKEAALRQNLWTLRDVLDQYRADRGRYPSSLADLTSAGYLKRIPLDPFTRSDATWQTMQDHADGSIADVHSGSMLVGLNGVPLNQW